MHSREPNPTDAQLLGALGMRIAEAREAQGLTQSALATRASVSRSTIQRLEAGASTQLSNLLPVLRALGAARDLDRICPRESAVRPQLAGPGPRAGGAGWRWGGGE